MFDELNGYWMDANNLFFIRVKDANPIIIAEFEDMDLFYNRVGKTHYISCSMTRRRIGIGRTKGEAITDAIYELKKHETEIGQALLNAVEYYGLSPRYTNYFGVTLEEIAREEIDES